METLKFDYSQFRRIDMVELCSLMDSNEKFLPRAVIGFNSFDIEELGEANSSFLPFHNVVLILNAGVCFDTARLV